MRKILDFVFRIFQKEKAHAFLGRFFVIAFKRSWIHWKSRWYCCFFEPWNCVMLYSDSYWSFQHQHLDNVLVPATILLRRSSSPSWLGYDSYFVYRALDSTFSSYATCSWKFAGMSSSSSWAYPSPNCFPTGYSSKLALHLIAIDRRVYSNSSAIIN